MYSTLLIVKSKRKALTAHLRETSLLVFLDAERITLSQRCDSLPLSRRRVKELLTGNDEASLRPRHILVKS